VFTVTLPAKMARFLARPWAEQREVYRGWWAYAKKEARHYWVRPGPARPGGRAAAPRSGGLTPAARRRAAGHQAAGRGHQDRVAPDLQGAQRRHALAVRAPRPAPAQRRGSAAGAPAEAARARGAGASASS